MSRFQESTFCFFPHFSPELYTNPIIPLHHPLPVCVSAPCMCVCGRNRWAKSAHYSSTKMKVTPPSEVLLFINKPIQKKSIKSDNFVKYLFKIYFLQTFYKMQVEIQAVSQKQNIRKLHSTFQHIKTSFYNILSPSLIFTNKMHWSCTYINIMAYHCHS